MSSLSSASLKTTAGWPEGGKWTAWGEGRRRRGDAEVEGGRSSAAVAPAVCVWAEDGGGTEVLEEARIMAALLVADSWEEEEGALYFFCLMVLVWWVLLFFIFGGSRGSVCGVWGVLGKIRAAHFFKGMEMGF